MKEFRKLKKALVESERVNNELIDGIVAIIRQERQSDATVDDILTRMYWELLVPNGINSDNTVF